MTTWVKHYQGTSNLDRYARKMHNTSCKRRKCPECGDYFNQKKSAKVRVTAHLKLLNGSIGLATTCKSCNSSGSQKPFEIEYERITTLARSEAIYKKNIKKTNKKRAI